MVYSNQFVVAVKVDGSILRESKGSVAVPFNSEYNVFLKNLSSVRATAKVSIDGTEASETGFIIPANGVLELERFIKDGNMDKGNRFKFIKRTGKIEKHRGIKAEDGLIRVEYRFEKPYVAPEVEHHYHYHHDYPWSYKPYYPYYPYPYGPPYYYWNESTIYGNGGGTGTITTSSGNFSNSVHVNGLGAVVGSNDNVSNNVSYTGSGGKKAADTVNCFRMSEASLGDDGITVPGSKSDQKFTYGSWFQTEDTSHVIVLHLVGTIKGKAVEKAVTVKTKPKCVTCGTANKGGVKFCKECGTALEVL